MLRAAAGRAFRELGGREGIRQRSRPEHSEAQTRFQLIGSVLPVQACLAHISANSIALADQGCFERRMRGEGSRRRLLKRHVQQEMRHAGNRGGKRRGAGRPPKGPRSSERHKARPKLNGRQPVLATARVASAVGSLRKRHIYRAVRFALYSSAKREDFRVVHLSLQRNHLHLIVEAAAKRSLGRGMQGLLIS